MAKGTSVSKAPPSRAQLAACLADEAGQQALFEEADRRRREWCGDVIHRRGIIEFSNACARSCAYCGLRRDNARLVRYRMEPEEVVACAHQARRLGYGTVVLQSGEYAPYALDELCRIVEAIKCETAMAVTLSIGERSRDDYRQLREAGADRYLLRFETSDKRLFSKLRPGTTLRGRLECLRALKDLGYQVGSGCMVGLPGQTLETLADDLLLMRDLDLDMAGIGPFIPHPQTPLGGEAQGDLGLSLRFVALMRLVLGPVHIPATTALGSIDPQGRQRALRCGANVLMPNVTPQKYRKDYEIYPHKICLTEDPQDCRGCTAAMILSLGRQVGSGQGHSLKTGS